MRSMKPKLIISAVILILLYVLSYVLFRHSHTEIWAHDGKAYLIFPQRSPGLYYFYRPVMYADGALTGMRFHIGPHR